jgi:DNA polymerase-3 subunit alpha
LPNNGILFETLNSYSFNNSIVDGGVMIKPFAHLHVHTEYSLLDGAILLEKLIDYSKQQNFAAVALTDHGNIFGAVQFFEKAKKAGIKPVLGIEFYITEDVGVKRQDNKYHHVIAWVQNKKGYQNLCKLIAHSYQEGFYFKPRIDYRLLKQYNEGLLLASACIGGHLPQLILAQEEQKISDLMDWYQDVFKDRFYLEVQPADQKEQGMVNNRLYQLAQAYSLPVIATCDCHYLTPDDHEAHEIMLSIQTQGKMTDADRYTFGDCRVHMRTIDEMVQEFAAHEEAVWNTWEVAQRCDFSFETGKLFFPDFAVPQEFVATQSIAAQAVAPRGNDALVSNQASLTEQYFYFLAQSGFERLCQQGRIPADLLDVYKARLERELQLIIKMGFVTYFLVVSEFIIWAKRQLIPVGPGRGSAAGSLVAWSLEITNIDPIKYNLLFERFLNPERISMPDIDIDFCIEGREKVIQYVKDRYGHDRVCQIITFGTMMAKGVLKDVARALGFPFEDSNNLTDLIPDQLKITLDEAIKAEPKLRELIDNNPKIAHLVAMAKRLEGLTRHASKHAAGIVISPFPIDEVLPVYIPAKTNDLVTQYAMTELEKLGFLKMDFLGLKNLTLLDRVIKLIAQIYGLTINLDEINLEDQVTFDLLCAGNTTGVFQLESDGIREVLRRLQPNKFEDIIAVNALYRPGPLGSGMVDDFIKRRHGQAVVEYVFPELQEVLEETYGVIVYQEQVMKIASAIAGYSLAEADILRKAMGKKKAEVMEEQKTIFVTQSVTRGFNEQKAGKLFDLMAYFAGYGFNKSHSAAYALIAYQTAYLKAHYPAEFMACLIALESSDPDKMSFYVQQARAMGLTIIKPHYLVSLKNCTVIDGAILYGLSGVKNVGDIAIDEIVRERAIKPFIDLLDLCTRVDLRVVNRRVLEHLIFSGAFDDLPGNRAQKSDELSTILEEAARRKRMHETGQMSLLAIDMVKKDQYAAYVFTPRAEWPDGTKLEREKEALGFYLSGRPLDTYRAVIQALKALPLDKIRTSKETVGWAAALTTYRLVTTKKGQQMAFAHFEDETGSAEVVIFPKLLSALGTVLEETSLFFMKVVVDTGDGNRSGTLRLKAMDAVPLEHILTRGVGITHITINASSCGALVLDEVTKRIVPGSVGLGFNMVNNGRSFHIQARQKIAPTPELLRYLIDTQLLHSLEV